MKVRERKRDKPPLEGFNRAAPGSGVPFKVLSWHNFRTSETFDYMVLSTSPAFTPPESDALVPVVEEYMRQI
jgi:hypothetical protein